MATINGSTGNEYIDAKIEWSYTQDKSTKKSTVTATLYYKRNNTGFTTSGTGTFSITINGTKTSATKTLNITENAWVKAVEATVEVSHGTSGAAKSIIISATGSIPDTTLTSTSVSDTVTLPKMMVKSEIYFGAGCSTEYFTGELSLDFWVYDSAVFNKWTIAYRPTSGGDIEVKSVLMGKRATGRDKEKVTLSENELSTIYKKIPNDATSGTLVMRLTSYSDSSYSTGSIVGSSSSVSLISLSMPSDDITQPTATMTLKPVNSLASPFDSLYIKGKTKVDVDFTNGTGKFGASIKSYNMRVLQQGKYFAAPHISEYLTTSGTVDVYGYVTDSRGFTREYHKPITVIEYSNPRILPPSGESNIICGRCDAEGNLSDSGTYLKIRAKRNYSMVLASGEQKNFCFIRYRYKADGGSWSSWETILAENATSDEVTTGALLEGKLLQTSAYVVEVGVVDTLGETDYTTISIPTDKIYMHRAGSLRSLGIGKYVDEENTVDIADDITTKFRGKVLFAGEAWTNLGLSDNVSESESNAGRWGGTGCYYRACAGEKHIYVAFNCAFAYSGDPIQVNKDPIPEAYRPGRNVYALCATGGRSVARILVNNEGNIFVDWIQVISAAEATTSSTVKWIDGYIDYWT
jgi:hypothetical protein